MIGLIAALLFAAIGIASAIAAGVDLDHLGHLSAAAAIASGAVAIAGAVAVAAGGARRRSRAARIGVGAIWAVGFLGIGLVAFDNRAAAALVELPQRFEPSLTHYCPAPGDEPPPPAPPPPRVVAQAQGCALIIRAYELGYTKDLGSCAPQEAAEPTEPTEQPERPPCRDRRSGEPLFHYAWRVLDRSMSEASAAAGSGRLGRAIDQTKIRLDYIEPLARSQWHAIASSPRSSHHLFTNLPAPRDRGLLQRWLGSDECSGQTQNLEARLDFPSASALVEHAHAMMLFDPRYGEPAGSCREHTIHWGQPDDICDRVRADPQGALDDAGHLAGLTDTLARLRHATELATLAERLGRRPDERLPTATEIASVGCLVTGADKLGFSRDEVELAGATVEVIELRVSAIEPTGPAQLEAYQHVARVLAGERYAGRLDSQIGDRPALPDGFLEAADFPLARLDVLRDIDPFVDSAEPLARPEIAAVYPLAIHLSQLIEVFRRRYRKQRRRL